MAEEDEKPEFLRRKVDQKSLGEMLETLSKKRERIRETTLAKEVRGLLEEINQVALKGAGRASTSYGEEPEDTVFGLGWKGKTTPMKTVEIQFKTPLRLQTFPFHLSIRPFRQESEDWLRFKVTANYTGSDEDVEVGVTDRIDISELKVLVRSQVENIRESSCR